MTDADERRDAGRDPGLPEVVVDCDGHVVEPADIWENYLPEAFQDRRPRPVYDNHGTFRQMVEGRLYPIPEGPNCGIHRSFDEVMDRGHVVADRLTDMDVEGIDVGVLYPSHGLLYSVVEDPAFATALAAAYNNWLADYCANDPQRLVGVGVLALQDVDAAVAEARRAVEDLGFAAVVIHPNPVAGRRLDDGHFDPVFAAVEELGVPLTIHESTGFRRAAGAERFDHFFFTHTVSHPFELMLAALSIVAGPVLARHPDLRVIFLESGCGWITHWLPRMDEHFEKLRDDVPWLEQEPSEYFRQQCMISCDPDELGIRYAMDYVPDNVVFATDYPHWDGIFPQAVKEVLGRGDLTNDHKRKLLGDNVRRFLQRNFPA